MKIIKVGKYEEIYGFDMEENNCMENEVLADIFDYVVGDENNYDPYIAYEGGYILMGEENLPEILYTKIKEEWESKIKDLAIENFEK
jgi:hypothetical protein